MNIEKQKAFLIHFVYITLILGLAFISFKYVMPLLMPFVIGLIVAASLRPSIDVIAKTTHIKRAFVSILILLIFYSAIGMLITLVGVKVFSFLKDIISQLPGLYKTIIEPALQKETATVLEKFPDIDLQATFDSINSSIFSFVSNASSIFFGAVTGFAGRLPSILIKFLFTIVSSFFFTIDFHRISDFVLKQFSGEKRKLVLNLKDSVIGTLGKFFKAYTTLIVITFIELSIGFCILRIPRPFLIGAIIAVVDILPILGTGAVLIPWIIIAFILGNKYIGFGILILYVVVTIVRQTLEPKIVGQQIGLHPVVTLLCMFVGAQLLGVVGLLLLPITATILKKMNDEGTIHLFK